MRKLASIQKIVKLEPIIGADKIEKATVLGWELVVKKSEFKEQDMCVYCEVDSVLPEKSEFEFLRERKFRIKTIKLKGQVSQGICFPLSILPKGKYIEDMDVTDIIGIIKYETPTERNERKQQEIKAGKIKRFLMRYSWFRRFVFKPSKADFPKFITKTDEDRIQLFPHICEEHKETVFQVTEKLDGQSATYFVVRQSKKWFEFWKELYIFGVCSRNFYLLKEGKSTWWTIAKEKNIKNKLLSKIKDTDLEYLVIQGEIIGTGIQGNKYSRVGLDFYVFNTFDNRKTYDNLELKFLWDGVFRLVPLLDEEFNIKATIHENVDYAKGKSTLIDTLREGVVVRNYEKGISFKIINPDFLLKHDL
jgi:hypothetical protein